MTGKLRNRIALAALVSVAGVLAGSQTVMAGSTDLTYSYIDPNDQTLHTISSGWKASWDDQFDPYIDVATDHIDFTTGAVYIEKSVNFTDAFWNASAGFFDPAVITFQQTDQNAVSNIVINDEQLTNNTSFDWNGFRMMLMNGGATFDPAKSAGFTISPFTTQAFTPDNTELDIGGGGIVAQGTTWFPGSGPSVLWINANPNCDGNAMFVLKEQPLAIPLPTAAWSGLSGLIGLALVGSRKKLRALIA